MTSQILAVAIVVSSLVASAAVFSSVGKQMRSISEARVLDSIETDLKSALIRMGAGYVNWFSTIPLNETRVPCNTGNSPVTTYLAGNLKLPGSRMELELLDTAKLNNLAAYHSSLAMHPSTADVNESRYWAAYERCQTAPTLYDAKQSQPRVPDVSTATSFYFCFRPVPSDAHRLAEMQPAIVEVLYSVIDVSTMNPFACNALSTPVNQRKKVDLLNFAVYWASEGRRFNVLRRTAVRGVNE